MGLLQPRTASVSTPIYVATTVLLSVWIFTLGAVIIYLLRRPRNGAQGTQRTSTINRSASYGSTVPRSPSSYPVALPSHPHRAHAPSHPPNGPPSFSASTRPTDFGPIHTASSNIDPVPPGVSTRIEDFGRTPAVSPTRNPVPAAPSSNEARQQVLLARHPSQAAMFARLQAMPLASDTTDMSNETADPGREIVNSGYMAMLAQRGIDARDHALVGSDDSTDAGVGAGAALSYAIRARGMDPRGMSTDTEMERSRFMGQGGRGRAMTFGQENGDGELGRVIPLHLRKMRSA